MQEKKPNDCQQIVLSWHRELAKAFPIAVQFHILSLFSLSETFYVTFQMVASGLCLQVMRAKLSGL